MKKLLRLPIRYWLIYFVSIISICIINVFLFVFIKSENRNAFCPRCSNQKEIIYNEVEEITFITVPRPFLKKNAYKRNKLAISSWLSSSNRSRVILFVNRSEFDPSGEFPNEIEKRYGAERIQYLGPIRSNHNGVPYIDDWFRKGIDFSQSKYVCFINGDILLSSKWLDRVKHVFSAMNEKPVVMIGQRIDFTLTDDEYDRIDFSSHHLLSDIDEMVNRSKHSDHSPYGVDTFTFRVDKPPFDVEMIPPFIMGRYNWDNWLVGWLNTIADTVTFNTNPPIYHVDHQRNNFDVSDNLVAINHHLKKANKDYFGSNYDTKFEISRNRLIRRGIGTFTTLPNL